MTNGPTSCTVVGDNRPTKGNTMTQTWDELVDTTRVPPFDDDTLDKMTDAVRAYLATPVITTAIAAGAHVAALAAAGTNGYAATGEQVAKAWDVVTMVLEDELAKMIGEAR